MIEILRRLKEQPPKIHDIKIQFSSDIHSYYIQNGTTPNAKNGGIVIRFPTFEKYIIVKASIYPKTVQLDIGCTKSPLIYDIHGVIDLTFLLGRLYHHMMTDTENRCSIPDYKQWIITHYHFGKDGLEHYSGKSFNHTYEDAAVGLIRFYSKSMPDGKTIPRLEQILLPHTTIDEEIDRMIAQEMTTV